MFGFSARAALAVATLMLAAPAWAEEVHAGSGESPGGSAYAGAAEAQELGAMLEHASVEEAVRLVMPRESGDLSGEKACLTEAIYFESKGEPLSGQMAVAQVIINRSRSGQYPSSICGVVNQKGQFTYSRKANLRPTGDPIWKRSRAVAELALQGFFSNIVSEALSFHSVRVAPSWRLRMKRVAQIGAHVFYAARR